MFYLSYWLTRVPNLTMMISKKKISKDCCIYLLQASSNIEEDVELDIGNSEFFVNYFNESLTPNQNVLISLNEVSYIDASGLWAVYSISSKVKSMNKSIALSISKKFVRRVFDITKMNLKIPIFKSEKEALHFLKINTVKKKAGVNYANS